MSQIDELMEFESPSENVSLRIRFYAVVLTSFQSGKQERYKPGAVPRKLRPRHPRKYC